MEASRALSYVLAEDENVCIEDGKSNYGKLQLTFLVTRAVGEPVE
jgi:hypothetical protein